MRTIEERIEDALDAALEMSFPASDPIAVHIGERHTRRTIGPKAAVIARTADAPIHGPAAR